MHDSPSLEPIPQSVSKGGSSSRPGSSHRLLRGRLHQQGRHAANSLHGPKHIERPTTHSGTLSKHTVCSTAQAPSDCQRSSMDRGCRQEAIRQLCTRNLSGESRSQSRLPLHSWPVPALEESMRWRRSGRFQFLPPQALRLRWKSSMTVSVSIAADSLNRRLTEI